MDVAHTVLALLFVLGFLLALLVRKANLSGAIGYLLAGLIIGLMLPIPGKLMSMFEILSEVSIILLFFEIGFEIHIENIKDIIRQPLYISLVELLLANAFTILILYPLGIPVPQIVVVGLIASFSSTVFTYKLLEEHNPSSTVIKTVLMVAAVEDIIIVISLNFIKGFIDGIISIVVKTLLFLLAGSIASYLFSKYILSRLVTHDERGLILMISYGLFMGVVADYFDLTPALGAFIGGLSISAVEHSKPVMKMFKPVRAVFITIFLLSMGVNIALLPISFETLLIGMAIGAVVAFIHCFSTLLSCILFGKGNRRERVETGSYLSTVSELALVIAYYSYIYGRPDGIIFVVASTAIIAGSIIASYLVKNSGGIEKVFDKLCNTVRGGQKLS